ncbi:MAG: hypothetical protein LBR69_00125 [Endomicrobium sp.]|jgi:hypothetical protein|nr:hypothetical protein [Endomicrobium sp.]
MGKNKTPGSKIPKIFAALFTLFMLHGFSYADFIDSLMSPETIPEPNLGFNELNLKAGYDYSSYFESVNAIGSDGRTVFNSGHSPSFALEYLRYINVYIAAGAGIGAQVPRSLEYFPGKFGFVPAYLALKVRSWPQEPGMFGYVVGHLGYNNFYADSDFEKEFKAKKGGVYYGGGFGISYNSFLFEFIYSISNCEIEDAASKTAIGLTYRIWTFSVGYNFGDLF